ncbi:MAG: cyclopropane-fatty-acyl-phospholipid synthase family protein [Hyphomicrobiales bacterium]
MSTTTVDQPAISVTLDNVREVTQKLPRIIRAAMRFGARLEVGSLVVTLPDQQVFKIEGSQPGPNADISIHDINFATRLFKRGDLGVAEGFMAEEWTSSDVTTFLELFCLNQGLIKEAIENRTGLKMLTKMRNWFTRNTRRGSKKNISAHYDLGNAFYTQWLDRTMTYSSALFENGNEDLSDAQTQKYRHLAEKTGFQSSDNVLEIGCGWGGFAEFAAKEIGCHVTALTISQEQFDFAKERVFKAGLSEKVDIKFQDYRDERGQYDRIASIEMFEAVGEEYWPVFFDRMKNCLKPNGTAGLQIITIQDRFFHSYRSDIDFIRRYIFPGGMLPSPEALRKLGNQVDLQLVSERIFGQDYAKTLKLWRERFDEAWPTIKPLGFDQRFMHLWRYYLHYCEAGFRSENIDVRQLVFARK